MVFDCIRGHSRGARLDRRKELQEAGGCNVKTHTFEIKFT